VSIAAAFDLAADGLIAIPGLPPSSGPPPQVPASLLKALGWVESGWQQFTAQGRPLLSFDFGYGIMQITSGMAGAFGNATGSIDPTVQSEIASDFRANIAYGARVLARKWAATPRIGNGDPAVVENWYYAVWAYNGWGWVNNPNNPRFGRSGTPATNPSGFPYQEDVLYLVAHPPLDSQGDPLWQPVPVSLPARSTIGTVARSFTPRKPHRQPPLAVAAEYRPAALPPLVAGSTRLTNVRIINSGIHPWLTSGPSAFTLTYHLLTPSADLSKPISPFTSGVLAYGQAATPIPHDLLPGSAVTVRVPLAVPTKPGVYRVVWDLQQGAGIWLSQLGVRPAAQTIRVVATVPVTTATPTPTPRPLQPREKLQFVADTAVRDGTVIQPIQAFEKGWLVFNGGSSAWQQGWVLQNVSGRSFAAKTIAVPPTEACRTVNVIATLHAPKSPGRYKGVWQMRDPQGHLFGDRLTVVVVVAGIPVSPTPTPIVTATPTPTQAVQPGHPTPTPTPVG
jgi:hypothetical protein